MSRQLVHPHQRRRVRSHFPDRCDIQQRGETLDAVGEPDETQTTLIANIPCALGPRNPGGTVEFGQRVIARGEEMIALETYEPTIRAKHVAVVGSRSFEIKAVNWDQGRSRTQLFVEEIT